MSNPVEALRGLRDGILRAELPLDTAGADSARRIRAELMDQIEDYLIPRLERLDAPLLAVIGGSTGAGKSTITNTLVGSEVSKPGVLRPTTRAPVLVCNPADRGWFAGEGVLGDLARVDGVVPAGASGLSVVTSDQVPLGLGLLDSPDIDSVETSHHDLAAQLLGAADLWLFVTTAGRYADAVPWAYLARAQERATALAVIVNRMPPGGASEVVAHLREMLAGHGLGGAVVFSIDEAPLVDGMIPAQVLPIGQWLASLVRDGATRAELIRHTLDGALASLPARVESVAAALEDQAASVTALQDLATMRYARALDSVSHELDGGQLLRTEVLERWQDHVGTGQTMARLQAGVSRLRDKLRSVFTGREVVTAEVRSEVESTLVALLRDAADRAALDTVEGWSSLPGGSQVLAAHAPLDRASLDRASPGLTGRIEATIVLWQDAVFDLVRDRAGSKLAVARTLSLGINGVGVALMIAVFSQTAGLSGAEFGVAGGTAAVSQAVLSAVFGEQAVRDLARQARTDLLDRLGALLDEERSRFEALLAGLPAVGDAATLREAAAAIPRRLS